jgi:hypothetical protein
MAENGKEKEEPKEEPVDIVDMDEESHSDETLDESEIDEDDDPEPDDVEE